MKLAVRDHDRDMKIVLYREKGGWPFPRIAEKFNISKSRARQIYERVVLERQENVNKHMGIGA
mgnify:CR=1 FL=1